MMREKSSYNLKENFLEKQLKESSRDTGIVYWVKNSIVTRRKTMKGTKICTVL